MEEKKTTALKIIKRKTKKSEETSKESTKSTSKTESVPIEHKNALKSAETYSKMMHMSKVGIYNQLTSKYRDKFSPEAAQYAVDTIKADWNANALESGKVYQNTMAMSPEAIRDQLISEYGD